MLRLGGVGQWNKLTSSWKQWWPESDERSLKSCHWSLELSIQSSMCWSETSEVAWVWSETGSHTQRTRKDQRKRQTSPDWQVTGLKSKGIYIKGFLSWATPQKNRSLHLPLRTLNVYIEPLWVQSHIQSRRSQHPTLSRLRPWKSCRWEE